MQIETLSQTKNHNIKKLKYCVYINLIQLKSKTNNFIFLKHNMPFAYNVYQLLKVVLKYRY
ncbi:hypothetical protein DHC50_13990 [Arenibacter sp. A80]|nr:hypothetical protein [Arenibacter sp. A80]RFT55785.1 hypothetical protein D0S24_13985 [Arenibacter sp. P308M17]